MSPFRAARAVAALRRTLTVPFLRRQLSTSSAIAALCFSPALAVRPSPAPLAPAALCRTLTIPFLHLHLVTFSAKAAFTKTKSYSSSDDDDGDPVAAAKSAIRSESDPDRLVSLFESSAHHPSFYGDRQIYKFSVQKLVRCGRPDLVERILEGAKCDANIRKSEGFLIRLLTLYSDAGMIDHSMRIFAAMPSLGCQRSERSFCALLSAFLENRQFDRIQKAVDRCAKEYSIAPGIASYNILLKALCSSYKVDEAFALLDEMSAKGVEPDIVCYNTVLDGYLKMRDDSGFEKVLKEIGKKKIPQTVSTYNCRIAALCAKGKSSEAEKLLDVMYSEGVHPNRIYFNTLIGGFCKEGNVDSAMEVYESMKGIKRPDGSGVSPDFNTYVTLLNGFVKKGEFQKAVGICKQCLDTKWAPPFAMVKDLVDGLIKSSQLDEAKDIIARMRKGITKGDAKDAWRKIEKGFAL
ncbi:pentatricopeptide repeat-containing protein At1g11630, mitochondrial-like [Curcuma longa]|uniref:pentatricopeptide repeat-containing protein At1g11630, mitochondrial-like n=1 Tax=Curcuma longa TaxID=136217 RepID=UPI003D9EDE1C